MFHAQHGDRKQSRRARRSIGLLELAGQARRRHHIAGAAKPGAAALAIGDRRHLAEGRGDRRGGMAL